MSQGQHIPAKSRGLWEPRTRLKIFAGITAIQCLNLGLELTWSNPVVPVWITIAMLVGNALLAPLLWVVASAAHPSLILVGATFAVFLARIAFGGVSLVSRRTDPDVFVIVVNGLLAVALFAFFYVTLRAILSESRDSVAAVS